MSGPSKTVYWTINKGAQQISLSSNTISVSNGESAIVNATWLGDGVLSATSSNPNIATVSVSGNQITISGVSIGGVGISVSVSEGTLYSAGSSSITVSVNNLVTVAIPTQSGTLTYNGNQQMPEWNNFDFSKMRQVAGSTFMAANAGTYTMMFSLLEGYKWSDGTTEIKRISWVINKANPELSVSPSKISVGAGEQAVLAVSRKGDGALSAASSNANAATVSISGTTATVVGSTVGETSIVVSCAVSANYYAATAIVDCTVTLGGMYTVTIINDGYTVDEFPIYAYASSGETQSTLTTVSGATLVYSSITIPVQENGTLLLLVPPSVSDSAVHDGAYSRKLFKIDVDYPSLSYGVTLAGGALHGLSITGDATIYVTLSR